MKGPALDVRPLRESPAFRRLWLATAASSTSAQLAQVAVLFGVWELTGSSAQVGAVGLATGVATAVCGLAGGTLADRVERRRLALFSSAAAAVAAVGLAVQAALGVRAAGLVVLLVGVQAGCAALGQAARRTFVPRLLGRERVGAGLALFQLGFQGALLAGPALGGLVVAGWGVPAAYLVDAVITLAALYAVVRLPAMHPGGTGAPRSTLAGLRFVVRERAVRLALLSDLAQTVLAMPVALFPAVNAARFGGDPRTLGLLVSAIAVGGLVTGLVSGPVARARRLGVLCLVASAVWGFAVAGFGLVGGLVPTLLCLGVAGAADVVSVIARGTLVQLATPDHYLGRVSAVEMVIGAGAPGLGNARAGLVAGWSGPETAALTGGVACLVMVALLAIPHPLRTWTPP